MSAFIVSPATMARVVQAFIDHATRGAMTGTDPHGWGNDGTFRTAEGAPAIVAVLPGETEDNYRLRLWEKLYRLNRTAVRQRYGTSAGRNPPGTLRPVRPERGESDGVRFKAAACLSYQCSEGDVPGRALFKALAWLEGRLAVAIAWEHPDVKAAGWDS